MGQAPSGCLTRRASRLTLLLAPLLGRRVLLRRAARPAHRDASFLDDLARIGVPVLVRLDAAAGIAGAVERVRVGLLLRRGAAAAPEDAVEEAHRGHSTPYCRDSSRSVRASYVCL